MAVLEIGEGLNLAVESPGFSLGKYSFNNINLNALIEEKDWTINFLEISVFMI